MKTRQDPMSRMEAARLLGMPTNASIIAVAQRICQIRDIPRVNRNATAQRVVRDWLKNPITTEKVPADPDADIFLSALK